MTLQAADVRAVEFTQARRGYSEQQVDDFLDEVVAALEERDAALAEAADAVRSAAADRTSQAPPLPSGERKSALDLFELAHRTAQEHVTAAESAAAELLQAARAEAEETIEAARREAARSVADAQEQQRESLQELDRERQALEHRVAELRRLVDESRAELELYLSRVFDAVREAGPAAAGPHAVPARSA